MVRFFGLGLLILGGLVQFASAATISGVLLPGYESGGNGFAGKIVEATIPNATDTYFGPVATWSPPTLTTVTNATQELTVGKGIVRTDVSQTGTLGANNFVRYNLTSYSQFYTPGGGAVSTPTTVYNSAYWEFTLNGIYNWQIFDQDPGHSGFDNNTRTFEFVKVVNGVETLIVNNTLGTGSANPSGTSINSGIYRLRYVHYDPGIKNANDNPLLQNSTNLDIRFDFVSEDGGSGVVPEPSSVAVFGLLGVGSAIARWRRKK